MRVLAPRTIRLSGHVCTIRLVASVAEGANSSDDRNLRWLLDHRHGFETEVKEEVAAALGPNFVVTTGFATGSVEVTAIIATVGVVYLSVSRYKSFIESLDLLVFHLKKVLSRFCGPMMSTVAGS